MPKGAPRVREPKDAVAAKRLVLEAVVAKKVVEVALVKRVFPEKVLLSVRRVELAAVIVKVPPAVIAVLLMVAREPTR